MCESTCGCIKLQILCICMQYNSIWIKLHVMSCTNNWWSAYSSNTKQAQLRKVPTAFWIVNNTYIQRHCLRRSCNCQSSSQFPSGCRFFSGTHPSACSPIKRRTQHQVSCTSNTSTTSPELTEMVCSVDMLRYPVVTLHSVPRCCREKGEKLTHLCNAWMCHMLCGVVSADRSGQFLSRIHNYVCTYVCT